MSQQYPSTGGIEVSFLDFDEELDLSSLDTESVYDHQCPICGSDRTVAPPRRSRDGFLYYTCRACGYQFGRTS